MVYLVFDEGYTATAGEDWMRPALMEEALRLGRVLAELAPHAPEVHGLVALMELQASRAGQLGGGGAYALQAAIAACHARVRTAEETDWARIAALYGDLARVSPSPVVELNRAVAVGMAEGPAAGLALVDALAASGALARYQWLPSVRGDLLEKLGRRAEAAAQFARAARMATNARERALL